MRGLQGHGSRQSAEIQREIRRLERELTAARKRGAELDAIFKKLYEDRVLGHLSVEQFQTLSSSYVEEQEGLAEEIPAKEAAIQELRDTVSSTDAFIASQAVHGYHRTDTRTASAVHPEDCGT